MENSPLQTRRPSWLGPIVVIGCGVLGLIIFGGLAVYRITYGWPAEVTQTDRDVVATVADAEKILKDLAIRRDHEHWSKTWFPGERCEISYVYDHPNAKRQLHIESYLYTERTRRESFDKWNELVDLFEAQFGAIVPNATFVNRDVELAIEDQSRFGSYNIGDRPVAYYFARRRGQHVYFGFIATDEIDDGRLGEFFSGPANEISEWTPSP